MKLIVSTHQGKLYDEELDYVVVKSQESEFAIMKDHIPVVSIIKTGYVKMVREEDIFYIAISNGVLEYKSNVINVIAQEAYIGKDIESAKTNLEKLRKDRLNLNRQESADFTQKESELIDNLKKAKAGNL